MYLKHQWLNLAGCHWTDGGREHLWKVQVISFNIYWLIYHLRRVFKTKLVSWNGRQRGAIACQQNKNNRDVETKANGKLDREATLRLLSCSPKRAWPASNWETQGWRDFWRRAKSPVKKKKLQIACHCLITFFSICHGIPAKERDCASMCDAFTVLL